MTKIDILSDPICPWCLIGKTFLDRALKARPNHNFKLEWHPYMLNPTMQLSGMSRKDYLTTKFGSKENAQKVYLNIKKTALEHKIKINFDDIKRTPNTLNAHRLIHWAGLEQKQNSAIDLLFYEYFVNGNDISNENTLANIANKIKMNNLTDLPINFVSKGWGFEKWIVNNEEYPAFFEVDGRKYLLKIENIEGE